MLRIWKADELKPANLQAPSVTSEIARKVTVPCKVVLVIFVAGTNLEAWGQNRGMGGNTTTAFRKWGVVGGFYGGASEENVRKPSWLKAAPLGGNLWGSFQ